MGKFALKDTISGKVQDIKGLLGSIGHHRVKDRPKDALNTTFAIDTRRSTIHCFSMLGVDPSTIDHKVKSYTGLITDEAFVTRFRDAVAEFVADTPTERVRMVSLILPDNAVAMDVINVPTMRNRALTRNALNLAMGELYMNLGELKVHAQTAAQNRQFTTFTTASVQKKLLTDLYSVCAEHKLLVDTATFASGAAAAAVTALNPKMKNESYLLVDVKDIYTRFVFVANGKATGYYILPFGLEFLARPKYVQEDMLFDHTQGELTVLNAREKAKAKKLTVLAEQAEQQEETAEELNEPAPAAAEPVPAAPEDDDEDMEDIEEAEKANAGVIEMITETFSMTAGQRVVAPKVMAKKPPRRLPKFMQRPVPETEEEIACENFRVFVKWALTLIASNEKLTALGKPESVYVNIPQMLSYVLDKTNEELEENGVEFKLLDNGECDANVLVNLELYGGFFPRAINPANRF